MNIQYMKELSDKMSAFMQENGFSSKGLDTGCFAGELKAYKIEYDDAKKNFSLNVAPVDSDGKADNYSLITTWFFDEDSHGNGDIDCIADDFVESVAADNGIKLVKKNDGSREEVAMPTKASAGEEPGIEAFTQKFLAMFPQYKDNYKDNVATYGEFLYVEFYKKYGIEKMRELLSDDVNGKKQLQKYFDMLGDMHYKGETSVGDLICALIIAGSFAGDTASFAAAADKYLTDYPFLKTAGAAAVRNYRSDKKLRRIIEG